MQNQPETITNTEFLTEILELCETHLDEGKYLRASNMLKNIHENKPVVNNEMIIRFPTPIKIDVLALTEDDENIQLRILGVVKRRHATRFMVSKIIYSVYGNETCIELKSTSHNFRFRCKRFRKILMSFFRKQLTLAIEYKDHFDIHNHLDLKKYYKFKNRYCESMLDNEDDEVCLDHDYVYTSFLEFVVDRIIDTLDFMVDEDDDE